MEKYECCEWIECQDNCKDCDSYQAIKRISRNVKSLYYSLGIERQILEEVKTCQDTIVLESVKQSLAKERHSGFYSYTIDKINERINEIKH